MKFFIDTANLDQIREAQELGVLDGVTTNPSLMAKEGITGKNNILKHYVDICNIVDGHVSAEVISTDFKSMVKEGEELAELHDQIVVKVPMIKALGIVYQPDWYFLAPGETKRFTMIFEALPKSCTSFTLAEIINQPGAFVVNGILRNNSDIYSARLD